MNTSITKQYLKKRITNYKKFVDKKKTKFLKSNNSPLLNKILKKNFMNTLDPKYIIINNNDDHNDYHNDTINNTISSSSNIVDSITAISIFHGSVKNILLKSSTSTLSNKCNCEICSSFIQFKKLKKSGSDIGVGIDGYSIYSILNGNNVNWLERLKVIFKSMSTKYYNLIDEQEGVTGNGNSNGNSSGSYYFHITSIVYFIMSHKTQLNIHKSIFNHKKYLHYLCYILVLSTLIDNPNVFVKHTESNGYWCLRINQEKVEDHSDEEIIEPIYSLNEEILNSDDDDDDIEDYMAISTAATSESNKSNNSYNEDSNIFISGPSSSEDEEEDYEMEEGEFEMEELQFPYEMKVSFDNLDLIIHL